MAVGNETIALFGIGTMAHRMTLSAVREGRPVVVWNREPSPWPGSGRPRWVADWATTS
jgi:hypothetical protein